jgi:Family of unknown function (DUF6188)
VTAQCGDAGLAEARGKWILPIGKGLVTQLRIDCAFTLLLDAWIEIRIETPFTYGPQGGAQRFEPSDAPSLAALLGLHQAVVTSAELRKDGQLTVAFAGGAVLEVLPDERYEAFQVTGSLPPVRRGFTFVACPGGGLAKS